MVNLPTINDPNVNFNSVRPALVNIEQKIFQEIVNLLL
jgi:hypothetical protein